MKMPLNFQKLQKKINKNILNKKDLEYSKFILIIMGVIAKYRMKLISKKINCI